MWTSAPAKHGPCFPTSQERLVKLDRSSDRLLPDQTATVDVRGHEPAVTEHDAAPLVDAIADRVVLTARVLGAFGVVVHHLEPRALRPVSPHPFEVDCDASPADATD